MSDPSPPNSNPEWTMNIQRSCPVLYFHFFWGIGLVILGWSTLAARWIPRIKPYHRSMGQIWIYGMIIQIYSSTYVSYNGFRWFIFMFGVICYGSLIIGHTIIRKFQLKIRLKHKNGLMTQPLKYVGIPSTEDNENNNNNGTKKMNDDSLIEAIKENEANSLNHDMKKTWFTQTRLKQIHGIFMFMSLAMLTGAGAAFTRRFSETAICKNIYCDREDVDGYLPTCYVEA